MKLDGLIFFIDSFWFYKVWNPSVDKYNPKKGKSRQDNDDEKEKRDIGEKYMMVV